MVWYNNYMENKSKQLIRDYLADGNYDRLVRRLKIFNIKLTDLQICRLIEINQLLRAKQLTKLLGVKKHEKQHESIEDDWQCRQDV